MKLIFVYNAKSGPLNAALDAIHKIVAPETYPCELCALTYGTVSERKEWRQYRRQSQHDMVFLHKDEFEEQYGQRFAYPLILCDDDGRLTPLITREGFRHLDVLDDLIDTLEALEQVYAEEEGAPCESAADLLAAV